MKLNRPLLGVLGFTLAISLLSPLTYSQAAAPKAGGACTTPYSATTIGGKNFSCLKNPAGKLVWISPLSGKTTVGKSPTKPTISGGTGEAGDDAGRAPGTFGGTPDPARAAALKKYSACLVAHGGKAFAFGGGRGFRGGPNGVRPSGAPNGAPNGVRPSGAPKRPFAMPSISPAQQKAMTACAALAPKFGQRKG